mmetsp:Transcript_23136/g.68182  ORF Transcript_23136/g.68182 Transcript_23136/m.68182 type:complete len:685 (-) Transcript_23136:113-2167(-)
MSSAMKMVHGGNSGLPVTRETSRAASQGRRELARDQNVPNTGTAPRQSTSSPTCCRLTWGYLIAYLGSAAGNSCANVADISNGGRSGRWHVATTWTPASPDPLTRVAICGNATDAKSVVTIEHGAHSIHRRISVTSTAELRITGAGTSLSVEHVHHPNPPPSPSQPPYQPPLPFDGCAAQPGVATNDGTSGFWDSPGTWMGETPARAQGVKVCGASMRRAIIAVSTAVATGDSLLILGSAEVGVLGSGAALSVGGRTPPWPPIPPSPLHPPAPDPPGTPPVPSAPPRLPPQEPPSRPAAPPPDSEGVSESPSSSPSASPKRSQQPPTPPPPCVDCLTAPEEADFLFYFFIAAISLCVLVTFGMAVAVVLFKYSITVPVRGDNGSFERVWRVAQLISVIFSTVFHWKFVVSSLDSDRMLISCYHTLCTVVVVRSMAWALMICGAIWVLVTLVFFGHMAREGRLKMHAPPGNNHCWATSYILAVCAFAVAHQPSLLRTLDWMDPRIADYPSMKFMLWAEIFTGARDAFFLSCKIAVIFTDINIESLQHFLCCVLKDDTARGAAAVSCAFEICSMPVRLLQRGNILRSWLQVLRNAREPHSVAIVGSEEPNPSPQRRSSMAASSPALPDTLFREEARASGSGDIPSTDDPRFSSLPPSYADVVEGKDSALSGHAGSTRDEDAGGERV